MLNNICPSFEGILPKTGFRPLIDATATDLLSGSLVVLYNIKYSDFETVIAHSFERSKFCYSSKRIGGWYDTALGRMDFKNYLFKVIS